MVTNEELITMLEVFKDREYIKINVEGINKEEKLQENKITGATETKVEDKPEKNLKDVESKPARKGRKDRSESQKKDL